MEICYFFVLSIAALPKLSSIAVFVLYQRHLGALKRLLQFQIESAIHKRPAPDYLEKLEDSVLSFVPNILVRAGSYCVYLLFSILKGEALIFSFLKS